MTEPTGRKPTLPMLRARVASLLRHLGLKRVVAVSRLWRFDRSDKRVLAWRGRAQFIASRMGARAEMLPCDTRRADHFPNAISHLYGADQSGKITYSFNSAGFRSEELDPDAQRRILLVGESHAFGLGVAFDDCFGQRIKLHLSRASGCDPCEVNVINLAVGGASADFCARTMLRQIDIVRPDLVVALLPLPDRIEDYTKDRAANYNLSAIDVDRIADMPLPVQGFLDLYNPVMGRVNLAKNALLMQMACYLRGIDYLFLSEDLRPENYDTPILAPLYDQLDHGRILPLHGFFEHRADQAEDGLHTGPATHEAVALRILTRLAALWQHAGACDKGEKLAAYLEREKHRNAAYKMVRDAQGLR